jgi:hypothetical protein
LFVGKTPPCPCLGANTFFFPTKFATCVGVNECKQINFAQKFCWQNHIYSTANYHRNFLA